MKKHRTPLLLSMAALISTAPFALSEEAPPPPATTSEPSSLRSFLDPIGDFARDSILHPRVPFELVPGKNPNDWSFSLEPYVWALGLSGDVGVKGLPTSNINFRAVDVIRHLQWGIFARGEVRKGRWGVLADGYYAALGGAASMDNSLYDKVNLDLQQSIVSLALAYRIIDDRRGYLDVYAGARYNFLGTQVDASLNDSRINEIATNATSAIANRIRAEVENAIRARFAESGLAERVAGRINSTDLEQKILSDRSLRSLVRDKVIRDSLVGGRVREALKAYIRAQAAARVAEARGARDQRLEAAANKAKEKLGKEVAKRIEASTPTYASGNEWWVDPIIGLRGQINLTKWLYLAAQGDVGGFGAGSQITWNTQATVGVNFTRNIFAEVGYRYMYIDYNNQGTIYNMNQYGSFSSAGVKF